MLVHSGSRGFAGDILKRYTRDGQASLREEDAKSYLDEHECACGWASRNRDLIVLRFLAMLEPGSEAWMLGVNDPDGTANHDQIVKTLSTLQSWKVIDIYHNNVKHNLWPPLPSHDQNVPPTISQQHKVYIHRKGAAPTHDPKSGLPLALLPLPGSRATPTLTIHPTYTAANEYGRTNAVSLAHGAGRARSRADAAAYVAEKYKGKTDDLLRGDFVQSSKNGNKRRDVHGGAWVVCEDK